MQDKGGRAMTGRVLLVEDEPNIAEAIRFILTREGWDVAVESDGAAALGRLQQLRPDLVILDLMLPGMSGLEILTALRASPDISATKVMMLTAKGMGPEREAAQRAGVSAFMAKPFSNAEMRQQVRILMEG